MSVELLNIKSISPDGSGYVDVTSDLNLVGTSPNPVYRINGVPIGTGGVTTVFGRSGAVVATAGDYTAAQVTNAVSTLGSYADPAWITSLAWTKLSGSPSAAQIGPFQTPWLSNINAQSYQLNNVGSIGIGTSAPVSNLDIVGSGVSAMFVGNPAQAGSLYLLSTTGGGMGLANITCNATWNGSQWSQIDPLVSSWAIGFRNAPTGEVALPSLFSIRYMDAGDPPGGFPTSRLAITRTGNVGVGRDDPMYRMDIMGDCNLAPGSVYRINHVPLNLSSQWTDVTGGIAYTGGNVGIGTNAPQAALHITRHEPNWGGVANYILLQQLAGQDNVTLRIAGAAYQGGLQTAIDFVQSSGLSWNSQMVFSVHNGGPLIEAMRITPQGALQIGPGAYTDSPGDLGVSRGDGTGVVYFGGAQHIYYNGSSWVFNPPLPTGGVTVHPSQPPTSSVGNGQLVLFWNSSGNVLVFYYRDTGGQLYQGTFNFGPVSG